MEKPKVYKPGTRKKEGRTGRGFSFGELKKAGIPIKLTKKLGLYIDRRRKTVHKENIGKLKKLIERFKE